MFRLLKPGSSISLVTSLNPFSSKRSNTFWCLQSVLGRPEASGLNLLFLFSVAWEIFSLEILQNPWVNGEGTVEEAVGLKWKQVLNSSHALKKLIIHVKASGPHFRIWALVFLLIFSFSSMISALWSWSSMSVCCIYFDPWNFQGQKESWGRLSKQKSA